MPEEIYTQLREYLDGMPGGFPSTESGVELRILEKLFSPEDARLTMQLRMFPEPPSVIAKRWGMSEEQAAEKLKEMADKGLIIRIHSGKHDFYQATQYQVGFLEFFVTTIDRELAEMVVEFEKSLGDNVLQQHRVVPVGAAVDPTSSIASYEKAKEIIKKQKLAAVADCICKKQQALLGRECEKPLETCLSFGIGADHMIRTDKAREISIDEALEIIDRAEKNAMILMPTNAKDIVHMCCCCSCCCALLRMLKAHDRPADYVRSAFQVRKDPESCNACGECIERCQMEAITDSNGTIEIDLARCIGCGLCVSTCQQDALSLIARETAPIPANYLNMLSELASSRNLGFGKLNPVMKMTSLPLFIKMLPFLYGSGLARPIVDQMAKRGWV
ncbi:MAG: 4Fe-4S binding protein [Actinobacteria bacterium]|nr:4Fe-4S binding protein [Actinomycetota bacterium]